MTTLCVPELERKPWPTLGPQVCAFIEGYLVHGPGDIRGEPARLDEEKRALIYRMYEVHPRGAKDEQGNLIEGRRRFKRVAISLRKGTAKTELAAWIAACELHPDGPVRVVDWEGDEPIGGGVTDPYIPMVAYTEEQTEELAYGALKVVLEESLLAGDFDIGLERIMRRDGTGKAEAVASAPNARDGARTTFQHFDETHRFVLPRLKRAHETMMRNIPKRKIADAWSLETTTAYSPGEGSIAEATMDYARSVAAKKLKDSTLFFFHRSASDSHDLATKAGLRAAAVEASGPAAAWSDIGAIVGQFDDPTADRPYLYRMWFNMIVRDAGRAFDMEAWKELARSEVIIPARELITLGFDGSRYEDSTALVATHVVSGHQWLAGLWEKPLGAEAEGWEVPWTEVDAVVTVYFERWRVWRLYADPWGWGSEIANWASRWGTGKDGKVWEWPTNRWTQMTAAVKNYATAIKTGALSHDGHPDLERHVGNAVRRMLTLRDADGVPLWVIQKERPDSPMKMDAAMAAVLSWEARTDAIASDMAKPPPPVLPVGTGGPTEDERRPEFAGIRGQQF